MWWILLSLHNISYVSLRASMIFLTLQPRHFHNIFSNWIWLYILFALFILVSFTFFLYHINAVKYFIVFTYDRVRSDDISIEIDAIQICQSTTRSNYTFKKKNFCKYQIYVEIFLIFFEDGSDGALYLKWMQFIVICRSVWTFAISEMIAI